MSGFGHVDLRVSSLDEAVSFYDALLPELGFTEQYHGGAWKVWAQPTPLPETEYVAITESASHVPNENRVAFAVADAGEVDRVAAVARAAGATEASGPREMPSYGKGYYALYCADPSGNRLEIYVRPP